MSDQQAVADVASVADVELRARLQFETFFADVTSRFLQVPAERLPPEIDRALAELVAVLDVDRATIGLFTPDHRALLATNSAARSPTQRQAAGFDFAAALPWYTEQVRRGRRLVLNFVDHELPPEAEAEMRFVAESGIASHTMLPLVVAGEILGALGVATFRRPRDWPPEFLGRLELLASAFAHAFYRQRSEARLREANQALERSLAEVRELKDRLEAENV
ncbi:MAG: GAF domain-containing protein, partial [Vicinamibacteria bacterium]